MILFIDHKITSGNYGTLQTDAVEILDLELQNTSSSIGLSIKKTGYRSDAIPAPAIRSKRIDESKCRKKLDENTMKVKRERLNHWVIGSFCH